MLRYSSKDWKFSQCFGEATADDLTEADILSAVQFDQTGRFLATGDKGGRVVVFEVDENSQNRTSSRSSNNKHSNVEYKFHCEFQSHEPEFDYLKSLEIEEKINQLKWCPPVNDSLFLLSTNDKTIKLWKIYEKEIKVCNSVNVEGRDQNYSAVGGAVNEFGSIGVKNVGPPPSATKKFTSPSKLTIPKMKSVETVIACQPRRIFSNAHSYHINSISVNSDGETYLSADDLRINLWNLSIANQSFNIVDIKPENMEELTEVITAADLHPSNCNLFMYSSSRGSIKLGDMRDRALCDHQAKAFEEVDGDTDKSFFSEIIASISDCKFTNDGNFIVARDYMTLKVWDIRNERKPLNTICIHDHLKSKLSTLYENDCIFDKFEIALSGNGKGIATGSYHNYFHIFDREGKNNTGTIIEATNCAPSRRKTGSKSKYITNPDQLDFTKKALNMSWHPRENTIAVCAMNQLFIYHKD